METLKKVFPLSFKYLKSIGSLIWGIIVYCIVEVLLGVAIGICSKLPLIGWIVGMCGGLVGIYCLAGIVILLLAYFKVIKD